MAMFRVSYLDEVDLGETVKIAGLLNIENGDNVLVIEVSQ